MRKSQQFFGLVFTGLLLFAGVCFAEDIYVTGVTKITMRTGPGVEHKIVAMLKSGTKLEIVNFQEDWTHVKTLQGKTGWVLSRFLTQKVPDALLVAKLEKENQELVTRLEILEEENKDITVKNAALVQIEQKYKKLKRESADFFKLDAEYKELTEQFEAQKIKIEELESDLNDEIKVWFLIGPGVFIIGLIFGLSTRKKEKKQPAMIKKTDFLIIGSGIAGLSYALKIAEFGTVTILTKKKIQQTNTALAQGGVAGVFSSMDSFELHVQDTLDAGDGLCDRQVAQMVVEAGPERIKELVDQGAHFNKDGAGVYDFSLGQEGGHSAKRIVYAHDLTGKEIEDTLVENARKNKNISILEDHIAVDLITFSSSIRSGLVVTQHENICCGAYVLNNKTGEIETFYAGITLLACGGASKVYLYTSNPDIATGDGIAMAYRAGASVANLEFVQFHPTCLYHPEAKNFLISEAVRGEGAYLVDEHGRRFMEDYSEDKELACRDKVARAIDTELKRTGADSVFLDITHKDPDFIRKRFPNIHAKCLKYGIDITTDLIPVVPAAHYMCGGVATDLNGKTDIQRLYAVGETACTGLHGANRLASNSLLEALVYSDRAYKASVDEFKTLSDPFNVSLDPWDEVGTTNSDEAIVVSHNWDEIRRLMWNYVGIVRSDKRLQRALRRIENIKEEINEYYWDFKVTSDLIELRNLAMVAELIIRSAMMRKESRGLHYTIEYPEKNDALWLKQTILKKTF